MGNIGNLDGQRVMSFEFLDDILMGVVVFMSEEF